MITSSKISRRSRLRFAGVRVPTLLPRLQGGFLSRQDRRCTDNSRPEDMKARVSWDCYFFIYG